MSDERPALSSLIARLLIGSQLKLHLTGQRLQLTIFHMPFSIKHLRHTQDSDAKRLP